MVLLQLNQDKFNNNWLSMQTTKPMSLLLNTMRNAKYNQPKFRTTSVKRNIANLLTEYYSILFNPDYRKCFRPMTDLSLLFPTWSSFTINPDTNFIVVPLPLPTYNEWTDRWRYINNCPFLRFQLQPEINERIRDMDYSIDNWPWNLDNPNTTRSNKIKDYPHTSPQVKVDWCIKEHPHEARLWTYKFLDLPNNHAPTLPYSLADYWPQDNINYVQRKFTLLEIPRPNTSSQVSSPTSSKQVDFRTYSSKEIIPTFFTEKFAEFFDFTQVDNITIVNYFEKQVACWTCLTVRDIKSAIKRLKYIVKHKNLRAKQEEQSTSVPEQPSQQASFNQNIRYWKYKWDDWERHEYQNIDPREYKYKSIDQLKSLYNNQWD